MQDSNQKIAGRQADESFANCGRAALSPARARKSEGCQRVAAVGEGRCSAAADLYSVGGLAPVELCPECAAAVEAETGEAVEPVERGEQR